MRKHPLIALTAFTALTASAIAGASTGTFASSSVLTSARMNHSSARAVPKTTTEAAELATFTETLARPGTRDLAVVHDSRRPQRLHLSSVTGLPIVAKPKPKPKPKVIVAIAAPVAVAPIPVPPVVTTTTTPPPAPLPAGGAWYELRMCESGGNYADDTGNGYYGAYQFALSTWYGLGFSGLPSEASPATQDSAAAELQAESGWGQWPACSAELGL
jgi:hypothetical protein